MEKNVYKTSISIIDEAVSEVRHISHNMMPAALMRLGLVPAIKDLTRKINGANSVKITLNVDGMSDRLDESKEIAVYRIIQEIMNNIVRHSEATTASIDLLRTKNRFFVEISDNGKGLAPDSIKNSKGIGWNNIESRVSMLNGEMEINGSNNEGTKIDIQFPI